MITHGGSDPTELQFVLPPDAKLLPVSELSPRIRVMLGCAGSGDDQVAVTRPGLRTTTRLITPQLAALLSEFREPSRLTDAIVRFSQARALDPFEMLDAAFDALAVLINGRLLVPSGSPSAEAIVPTLGAGQALAGYEVDRLVSSLEDTEVYLARASGGNSLAIKIARPGAPQVVVDALNREARILQHLGGRHSPALVEYAIFDQRPFIAMEWRQGVAASTAAHRARASADRQSQHTLCRNILAAYSWLHDRGVVHGDVHPGNIIVGDADEVTILDYGRSHVSGSGALSHSAEALPEATAAMRAGIPYFYEPELARALLLGDPLPPPSYHGEQYSLAALLYYLLTGVHYNELSPEHNVLLAEILERPPLPFLVRGAEPWPAVEAILTTALAKDPTRRFSSVAQFCQAFEETRPHVTRSNIARPGEATRLLDAHLRAVRDCLCGRDDVADTASPIDLAWFAYRASLVLDDPELLAAADVWASRAKTHEPCPGIVHAVDAHIHRARGDQSAERHAILSFLSSLSASDGTRDEIALVGGRSGALICAAGMLEEAVAESPTRQPLTTWMRHCISAMWDTFDEWPPIVECLQLPHLGMAHGWAGVLYATLRACRVVGMTPPTGLATRLDELASLSIQSGRGACWTGTVVHAGATEWAPSMAPGWCSGSAGHTELWTLAYRQLGDEQFRRLAERAAWYAVDHPATAPDLCCGTTGRAFAVLGLYQVTGTTELLIAAHRLAYSAAASWQRRLNPLTLRRGPLGTALLIVELEAPERAVAPTSAGILSLI